MPDGPIYCNRFYRGNFRITLASESRILGFLDFTDDSRGEGHSASHVTDAFPYYRNDIK